MKALRLIIFFYFFIIAVSSTTTEPDEEFINPSLIVIEKPPSPPKFMNGTTNTYRLSDALLIILMRTSLLYIYFVMTLYYIVLMEAEDTFSRFMSVLGKCMVIITIGTYVIAEYFLPSRQMYRVISRVAVILFMMSFVQIIHLALCIFRAFMFWRLILIVVWRKMSGSFLACFQGPPPDEDTRV